MDASGGRGLAVLAGGYKGTLPGWAGSRVRTTGCWATTVERGPLWASPVAMSSPPLHPELTAAPLAPSWQDGTVPHPSPHTGTKTLPHSPCPAVAASPGDATLLMSGQGLRGLFRVAGSGCQERMEQRLRSQAGTIL